MHMRKIILNLAKSLDGYICDVDGGYAWLKLHGDHTLNTHDHFDVDAEANRLIPSLSACFT